MVTRALAKNWKRLFLLRRPRRKIPIHLSLLQTKTTSASIFEQLPQEELVAKSKSRLRDRQFLPGSTGGGFPEFLADPRDSFPFGVRVKNSNKSSLAELTAKCMEYVEENLPLSPAILFRGLPAKTAEDFSIIAHSIPGKTLAYEGGVATRRQVDKNAGTWTASDDPAIHTIEMHNELSYNAVFPYKVYFFCLNEPDDGSGGETPLVKNSELLSKLDSEVVRKFEAKQIRYVRYLPDKANGDYLNWQQVFITEDKETAQLRAKEQGYNVRWDESGDLYLWQIRSAFLRHPVTKEKVWFNQVTLSNGSFHRSTAGVVGTEIPDNKLPYHTYYGDGSEIEPEVLQHIRATSWECAVGFRWKSGDLLVLDNLAVQHGRVGFTGDRKVLVYLTA